MKLKVVLIFVLLLFVSSLAIAGKFYAIKRANITTTSVTLTFSDSFGENFSARGINVVADSSNTADLCIDWTGGTAVCPASNTAGDDRIPSGASVFFDDFPTGSISVIAASGTQTVYVRSFQ